MPAKIRVLPENVINQIAAGEIIENPASLIKELIENSLDAGSTKISVEIVGGGHLLIEVTDNGSGMAKDDAILCFERHATSKISEFTDLLTLKSMGFRGEALASIAAVSKLELETSEKDAIGTKVICHGGKIFRADPFSRNQGTTIRVADLFYNTPARKKFQKAATQATQDIVKMITRVALAHSDVAFILTSNGKDLVRTSAKSEKRIEEVLGKGFLYDTKEIFWEKEGYKITGIVGSPQNVKSNRLQQYLLINKRPVISQLVERAIQSGFGTRIGTRDYPLFVLSMEIPPEKIDVNVHPQKIFVRFCEEEKVHQFVKSAIERSFFEEPKKIIIPKFDPPSLSFKQDPIVYKPRVQINEELLIKDDAEVIGFYEDIAIVRMPQSLPYFPEEKLMFVDTAKLDAKVEFQRILNRLREEKQPEMENLLFPEVLKFSGAEEEAILRHQTLLQNCGIAIRPFGNKTFMIDALAPMFSADTVKKILDLLLTEFHKEFTLESVAKVVINFRPPKIYSKEALTYLLQEVLKMEDPFYAPNGKLIMVPFNKEELFESRIRTR